MFILPIRTETPIRKTPTANLVLIFANAAVFLLVNQGLLGARMANVMTDPLALRGSSPELYQFVTYQFRHGDVWHLLGNMLFLWVFGNSVNGKMGDWAYLAFYLAGGVFAALGYAWFKGSGFVLVGASGSIAAITTAYLVLFPRSRVTVMVAIFLFIHFFQWPAMVIIGVKIILWDNIIAPSLTRGGSLVAHEAHLAGYLMGFVGALAMLAIRAVPRDQFDLLALWKRWNQRRAYRAMMTNPQNAAYAQYGRVARPVNVSQEQLEQEERQLDCVSATREQIAMHLSFGEIADAARLYEELMLEDPKQCLSERGQVAVAREFYSRKRYPQAAAAFDRFLACYSRSSETTEIRLLLGIIYARDLKRYEAADMHLTMALNEMRDTKRRKLCLKWLGEVRTQLGKPAPEAGSIDTEE